MAYEDDTNEGAIPEGSLTDNLPASDNIEDRRDETYTPQQAEKPGALQELADTAGRGAERWKNAIVGGLPEDGLAAEAGTNDIPTDHGLVAKVLSFGRSMYGLGGGQKQQAFDDGGPVEDEDVTGAIPEGPAPQGQGSIRAGYPSADVVGRDKINEMFDSLGNKIKGAVQRGMEGAPRYPQNEAGPSNAAIPENPVESATGSPVSEFPKNLRRIYSYLMGADAAKPEDVQRLEAEVDPTGQKDKAQVVPAVVSKAAEGGNLEEAWKVMQFYRKKYDASQGFARAAAESGNLQSAADAATKMYDNLPDGVKVQFLPGENGVTATVMDPTGSGGDKQIPLTAEQFHRFLGKDSQYDNILQKGAANVLEEVSKTQGTGEEPAQAQQPARTPGDEYPDHLRAGPGEEGIDPATVARSRQMFPWVSQNPERLARLEQQHNKNRELENNEGRYDNSWRTEVADRTARGRETAAKTRADAEVLKAQITMNGRVSMNDTSTKTRLLETLSRIEAAHQDTRMKGQIGIIREAVRAGPLTGGTLTSVAGELTKMGIDINAYGGAGGAPQAPAPAAPGAPPPQQAPSQQSAEPPPGVRQGKDGKWYMLKGGKYVPYSPQQ